jgi:hypothetical protein
MPHAPLSSSSKAALGRSAEDPEAIGPSSSCRPCRRAQAGASPQPAIGEHCPHAATAIFGAVTARALPPHTGALSAARQVMMAVIDVPVRPTPFLSSAIVTMVVANSLAP